MRGHHSFALGHMTSAIPPGLGRRVTKKPSLHISIEYAGWENIDKNAVDSMVLVISTFLGLKRTKSGWSIVWQLENDGTSEASPQAQSGRALLFSSTWGILQLPVYCTLCIHQFKMKPNSFLTTTCEFIFPSNRCMQRGFSEGSERVKLKLIIRYTSRLCKNNKLNL